jgi:hypothetical protein
MTITVTPPAAPEPCAVLAGRACDLYGEGSEECLELRARVRRRAPERGRDRCQQAMDRLDAGELVPQRESSCQILAARKCAVLGENTEGCVASRRGVARTPDPLRERACLGDLLVGDGLGSE